MTGKAGRKVAWYRNMYQCSACGAEWEDEWSCTCDDECPNCSDSDYTPIDSEDLSVIVEQDKRGRVHISYSPPEADHKPDYRFLAIVANEHLATLLARIAFDLAHPR